MYHQEFFFYQDGCDFFQEEVDKLPLEINTILPSEWTETSRRLPSHADSPGPYSFDLAPHIKEPLDCLAPSSPIREVYIMKGVQVCVTTGLFENRIGYSIEHMKDESCMMLTADNELGKIRMDYYIMPMINDSGLAGFIMPSDEKTTRRTGQTATKLEWQGGGFLLINGAQNPNKGRSVSIQILLGDELDGYKNTVGKGEDPWQVFKDRTKSYPDSKKILGASTPLEKQTSKIYKDYLRGDQRKWMGPCKHCGEKQEIVWHGVNDDGTIYGFLWELDDDKKLIEESVCFICRYCQGEIKEADKHWMLSLERAEWVPTAKPENPTIRSYHMPSLLSQVQPWTHSVYEWLNAWDVEINRVKDMALFQQFYNNVKGWPFEVRGSGVKYERAVTHRRSMYQSGEIPNHYAVEETGAPVLFLTCTADVHPKHIDILVMGWCLKGRSYSIEWCKVEGDCEDLHSLKSPWNTLRKIMAKTYVADDKKRYKAQVSLVDAGFMQDLICRFCAEYSSGVYPIIGKSTIYDKGRIEEFRQIKSKLNDIMIMIHTNIYKDRLAVSLRREWSGQGLQPEFYPNFPTDFPKLFFTELSNEYKREKTHPITKKRIGHEWYGQNNHASDLMTYSLAAVDMMALEICQQHLGLESINHDEFFKFVAANQCYYELPQAVAA